MKKILHLAALTLLAVLPITDSLAKSPAKDGVLTLSFSDQRPTMTGVKNVNAVLRTIGVRVSTLNLPDTAIPILEASKKRAVTKAEQEKLLSIFALHRGELLEQISSAGRQPEAHRGGYLSTSEVGGSPYPKVYDMQAMTPEVKTFLQSKFGKLHVNSSEDGVGIDEVMTLVSGGDWKWFFVLPDNVVVKLTLAEVTNNNRAWRISYPGLVAHGAFLDSDYGLVVAHAHGPKNFVMRYQDPSVSSAALLGNNDWIDLTSEKPQLLEEVSFNE